MIICNSARKVFIVMMVCVTTSLLWGCQTQEEAAAEALQKSKELLSSGNISEAKLELKNAQKSNQNVGETYYLMALLDEKNNNFRGMRTNLQKAVELEPGNIEAKLKLGKVLLLFRELGKATTYADEVLQSDADNQDALILKASVLSRQKKQQEAVVIVEKVLLQNAKNIDALSLKALLLMQQKKYDESLVVIDSAIMEDKENFSLYIFKIQLDAKRKDIDAVIQDYQVLTKQFPEKIEFSYKLAQIYAKANRKEEAEQLLRQVVADNPNQEKPKIVLLTLLKSVDEQKMEEQLTVFLDQFKSQPVKLLQMSKWMIASGLFEKSNATLQKIVDSNANSKTGVAANLLLAKLALQRKDFTKSLVIVNQVLKQKPDNQEAFILKARIMLVQNRIDEAIKLLQPEIKVRRESDEMVVLLAQALKLQGDSVQAEKLFRKAFEINPGNLTAAMAEFDRAVKKKNLKNAKSILKKALKSNPHNINLLHKSVQIKMSEKDWNGAQNIIKLIQRKSGGRLLASFLQGKIHQEQGDCLKAIELYQNLLQKIPSNSGALNSLAACHETLNKRNEMLAYLSEFNEQNPQVIPAYILKSKLLQLNGKSKEAIATINRIIAIDERNIKAYSQLANIYSKMGNNAAVLKTYKQALEKVPGNVRISLLLASFYERNKDFEKAVNIYERLVKKNPQLDVAVSNLAAILVDHYGVEDNLKRAKTLTEKFKNSDQPFFSDTYAWVELKLGNTHAALKIFKKNILLVSDIPVFRYHLGVAYLQLNNKSLAKFELQQAIELGKTKIFVETDAAKKLLQEIKNSS